MLLCAWDNMKEDHPETKELLSQAQGKEAFITELRFASTKHRVMILVRSHGYNRYLSRVKQIIISHKIMQQLFESKRRGVWIIELFPLSMKNFVGYYTTTFSF